MVYVFRIGYVEMNITIKFVAEKWSEELASDTTHAFFLLAGKIKQNVSEISMYGTLGVCGNGIGTRGFLLCGYRELQGEEN